MHTTLALQTETEAARLERFSNWYDRFYYFDGEPTVITIHEIWQQYGGPEEGGWYYQCGEPIENICIFSKEAAVSELLRLHAKYEDEEGEYDIRLDQKYAEYYPSERPHYE
jgi:hypothetical protein